MKSRILIAGALASGLVAVSAAAASASTVLTDGTFGGTIDVLSHVGDPLATATGGACASCGNPGNGLTETVNYSASSAAGFTLSDVGLIDHSLSYDPLVQGAIASINASYDRFLTGTNITISVPFTFRLVIEQGGVDYVTAKSIAGTDTGNAWHTLSVSNLVASDFSSINFTTGVGGSAHPDFAGGPMLFGVEALTLLNGGQVLTGIYDNIDITVNETPLPATLPLFASGLGALGLITRRRRKKVAATAV